MSFADLGLSDKVVKAAQAAGYTSPTPIQEQAIPHVLARKDVLGIAQTGTGKTAAFTLPMLTLLESGRARARMPRTLILEPTRELAAQVEENFVKYGSEHKLSVALLIGGVSFGDQDAKIQRGADVLIATPGRLLDHFERGKLLLTGVELFVIDEADRMLDMGFIPDIERIAKLVPFTRQTLFFSATMPPEVQVLADTFLHNPVKVEVARASSTATTIQQILVSSGSEPHQKRAILRDVIRSEENLKNAIIFCNRKRDVATLHRSLVRHGFSADALHGDMDQRSRMQALDSFRNGETALLVASDVAARGLDIPDVSHVFNYDVPFHAEDYVHRIGRTGRAGKHGIAYTLVARGDEKALQAIEELIGNSVVWKGKSLTERTEEDDSYSAPDRGTGWRKHGQENRHSNNKHKRRDKGRERAHDPVERAAPHHPEQTADKAPPRENNHHRDNRRDDHYQRRNRYDNEPDISVIGFGDHIPAFMAREVPSFLTSSEPGEVAEHRYITPTSLPPRALEKEETVMSEEMAKPEVAREDVSSHPEEAEASKPSRKTRRRAPRRQARAENSRTQSEISAPQASEPELVEQGNSNASAPVETKAPAKKRPSRSVKKPAVTNDVVTADVPAEVKTETKDKKPRAKKADASQIDEKKPAKKVAAKKTTVKKTTPKKTKVIEIKE